ncbi:MAG: polysaccharide biosynthesis C-terminal domain-containing protein [Myxococcota bacterium]
MDSPPTPQLDGDRESVVRGLLLTGLGHLINVFEPLLTLVLVRLTGAAVWGLFLLAESIGYVATRLASVGLDRGLMWDAARSRDGDTYRIRGLQGALLIGATAGFTVAAIGQLVLPWLVGDVFEAPEALEAARVILWTTPISVAVSILIFTAQGLQSVGPRVAVQQITVPLITRGFPLALLLWPTDLAAPQTLIAIGHMLGNLAALGVAILLLKRRMTQVNATLARDIFWPPKAVLHYSAPAGLSELLSTMMVRVDVWMLAAFMDASAVGLYGVILSLSKALRTLRHAFTPVVTPIMSEATYRGQTARIQRALGQSVFLMTCLAAPILVALWTFSEPLLTLYGPEFSAGSWPLIVLCLGTLIHVVAGLASTIVAGAGRADLMLLNHVLPIALNVGLNLWLIPDYGVLGAALATASSLTVMSLLELAFARRIVGAKLAEWGTLEPLIVSAGGAGLGWLLAGLLSPGVDPLLYRIVVLGIFALLFAVWLLARGRRRFRGA